MSDWKNVQYKDGKMRTSEGGGGGGSSTFAGLDDVSFSNLQNGQVPKYNSATQKWENADESGGGGTVTDVTLDGNSVVNGQGVAALTTPNVSDLKDANISNPSDGQTLQYNNTSHKWENVTPASGGNVDDVKVNGSSVVDANKVAQITSYKEVTQAEYNALPDSKLNDGILYAIKDSAGADGFPPLIYSDEEREIGVWRDGKPLYQKMLPFNFASAVSDWTLFNDDTSYDLLISANGYVKTSSNTQCHTFYSSIGLNPRFCIKNDHKIYYYTEEPRTGYVIVQYTKTTDTPGSGTWTTDGTYAKHYSTEEKVIGTWIDGKPVYERVFDLGADVSIAYNTFTNTAINASQMKVLVDAWGIYSTGVTKYSLMANISNNIIRLQTDRNGADANVRYVILQYTKITD